MDHNINFGMRQETGESTKGLSNVSLLIQDQVEMSVYVVDLVVCKWKLAVQISRVCHAGDKTNRLQVHLVIAFVCDWCSNV
jgi:hypothetical protein